MANTGSPTLGWTHLDDRAVDTSRVLAADAVERAGHGHPGTAMALAPVAYLLFQKLMRHDPLDPHWVGRDRFVLSPGHTSMTLYTQLFLSGYGLELSDLRAFRQWGSNTPGHPELGHTAGVETTTGPLGQGIANAVGMAMAARFERGLFDPGTPAGESPFDHTIWAIVSDGDLEEGVTAEASSLAGHQKLGNLIAFYDDNHISIEGDTATAFSEDVLQRYAAYGWHIQRVTPQFDGDVPIPELHKALKAAQAETDRPSLIACRTEIAWPAPLARNTAGSHGAALGAAEVAATKQLLGFDPDEDFAVQDEVLTHTRGVIERARQTREEWDQRFAQWRARQPDRSAEFDRISARALPEGWQSALPQFEAGTALATRAASGKVLVAVGGVIPELWGGSADLAGSNNTTIDPASSFLPSDNPLASADPYGRTIHYGIREHAMGAVMNGIALHGLTITYGGTFLIFSDYMRPAVRLAAMMKLPVTYVWTHDSIGVGEDGPTHQPVEHLATLRAIPGLNVVRPADANETAIAWGEILRRRTERPAPHGLALTRQKVPVYPYNLETARGGYVHTEAASGTPDVILIGSGSELQLAVDARERLEFEGIATRVVSMPSVEWFEEQDADYRDSVLPSTVLARVAVEAGIGLTWHRYVGATGKVVSIEHYGACGSGDILFREFGITAEAVAAAARETLTANAGRPSGVELHLAPCGGHDPGSKATQRASGWRSSAGSVRQQRAT